jgi:diguanylate cyclase (GGDEF)-like protein
MPGSDFDDLIKLSFFTDVAKAIVAETTVRGVLNRLMEQVGECFSPLNWSVLLLDRRTDQLEFRIAVGKAADALVGVRIPAFEGLAGWVVRNGSELIVEDVATDARFSERIDNMTGFKTESIIAVPLKSGNRVFGVIELVNKLNGGQFSALEMKALATMADFAAIAIEKAVLMRQIKRLAMTDALTGVLNRRGLARALDRERARMKRYGGSMAFILADVDNFKQINDQRGHAAGDMVLKTLAEALVGSCRESDVVARFGGDEFLIAMPCTDPLAAEVARQRFAEGIKAVAQSCPAGPFTVSLGVHAAAMDSALERAIGDAAGHADLARILEESDRDLYRRKEAKVEGGLSEDILAAMDDDAGNREFLS